MLGKSNLSIFNRDSSAPGTKPLVQVVILSLVINTNYSIDDFTGFIQNVPLMIGGLARAVNNGAEMSMPFGSLIYRW